MAQTFILNQDLASGSVDNSALGTDSVTTVKITDLNVTLGKLAADSVDSSKIVDGSILDADIAATTITGGKLVNDTITAAQIAPNAVGSSELSDNAVDTAAIQDNSVTLGKMDSLNAGQVILGDAGNNPAAATMSGDVLISNSGVMTIQADSIETGMLEASVVETANILNSAVTTAKIANSAVITSKIADSNVTLVKMASDSVDRAQLVDDAVGNQELDLTAAYALSGSCSFSEQLTIPAVPAGDTDAASKGYVDALMEGLSWKHSVSAKADSNVNIGSAPATIDGVTMAAGDRVLLTAQTTDADNGIYVWSALNAAMARSADADVFGDLQNAAVFVADGSSADEGFTQSAPLTGFGGQNWVQFSGAGNITAGLGLTKAGNTIDVGAFTGVTVNADTMAVDYGSATTLVCDQNAVAGLADTASRSDHKHAIACAVAVAVGTANAEGVSDDFSRADHVHELGQGSINASNLLVAGVIDNAAIGVDAVRTAEIQANAVTANELADNAVDTASIIDLNVTLGKMAANSVDSSKIVDASIMLADLNTEVINSMSGYDVRVKIAVANDGTTVFNVGSGSACPLTTPGHLLYVNGRLMELGAGGDYTMADNAGQTQATFGVSRFDDDVISVVFNNA